MFLNCDQAILDTIPKSDESSLEVSLEANPGDLFEEDGKLQSFLEAGINRVSLGIQVSYYLTSHKHASFSTYLSRTQSRSRSQFLTTAQNTIREEQEIARDKKTSV